MKYVLHFDGACEPNPGKGSWGWTLDTITEDGVAVRTTGCGIMPGQVTNNMAEYTALGMGVKSILQDGRTYGPGDDLIARGDSKLVINQVNEEWVCRSEKLAPLLARMKVLLEELKQRGLVNQSFEWIPREENGDADKLSRAAWEGAAKRHFPERIKTHH